MFELLREPHRTPGCEAIRIGVTDRHSRDLEAVVVVESADQGALSQAVVSVEACLERLHLDSVPTLALAVLGTVSRRFLSALDKSEGKEPSLNVKETLP